MIRSTKTWRALAATAAATLVLASCGTTDDSGDDDGDTGDTSAACDLKIYFFGAQTGGAAALGINASNGAELAINQYNEANEDCQVGFEKIDSQSDAKQAPGLATEVASDEKVIGVVGPLFSGESFAANPVFDEAGVPLISASATNPDLSTKGWKVFHRVLGNDATQGPEVTTLIKEVAGLDQTYIVEDDSPYGKGLSAQVQKDMGAGVVGVDAVKTGETDFSGVVNTIIAKKPASVFFSGYYPEAGPFAKQLKAAGYEGVLVTADGVKDPEFIKLAGAEAAEGTLITCPCLPGETITEFNDAYVELWDVAPGTYSAEAYDAMNIFLDGIAEGIDNRADMLEFVNNYDEEGITKNLAFEENGEPTEIPVWGYEIKGGEIIPIKQLN